MRIKTDKKQFDIRDNETEETGEGQTISNSGLDKEQEYEQKQVYSMSFISKILFSQSHILLKLFK